MKLVKLMKKIVDSVKMPESAIVMIERLIYLKMLDTAVL